MVAELRLLLLLLTTASLGLGLGTMATPAPTQDATAFGGTGTLGSNFKLMPPNPQEVTTENWPD